ncbi:basic proline-rich protein-like [Aquila chrysaetos chrysaetos]|uniref:basic proline-rich protein-like n=1 Tax=Aquila chrysaetos chrysaetos TaxID=223781 RepID=UPI00117725DF|nr:basic proline-rich protein-like [Aquila chrysaetos chrysaetos]
MAAVTWELAEEDEEEGQGFPSGPPALGGGGRLPREAPPAPEGGGSAGGRARGSLGGELPALPRPRPSLPRQRPPLTRSPPGSASRGGKRAESSSPAPREEEARQGAVRERAPRAPSRGDGERGARSGGGPSAPSPLRRGAQGLASAVREPRFP